MMKGILFIIWLTTTVSAHMQMIKPYPIRSPLNTEADGKKDYSYTNPLKTSGDDYPCKGYANDPFVSQETYRQGSSNEMEIIGSATHEGGSCQLALSYDGGGTFKVIESIERDCGVDKKWTFEIPSDAPSGQALFAWTWFNKIGNREMYMNCAMVTIEEHGGDTNRTMEAGSFEALPELFVANVNGEGKCVTIEGEDVAFPMPGPKVIGKSDTKGYKCSDDAAFLDGDVLSPKNASIDESKSVLENA